MSAPQRLALVPSDIDLKAFAGAQRLKGRAEATIDKRRKLIGAFDRWLGTRPLTAATAADVAGWLDVLPLTPVSRNSYISDLRGFYRWAMAEGIADHDPTTDVRRPSVARPRRKPYGSAGRVGGHLEVIEAPKHSLVRDPSTAAGRVHIYRQELLERELSPRTVNSYVREVQRAEWACEAAGYSLRNVPAIVLGQYVEARLKTWSTRKLIRSALKHYWEIFKRKNPPLWVLRVPRKPRMICRALEDEEAATFAAYAVERGGTEGFAVLLGLYQALRREEISAVAWHDFDDRGWISIMGKGEQPARLPLHPVVVTAAAALPRYDSTWVFPGRCAGHVSPSTIWSWIRRLAGDAGLEHVTPHRLRHTALAVANDNTGDLRAVQGFARHAKVDTTAGYTRTTERRLRDVIAAVRYELVEPPVNPAPAAGTGEEDQEWQRLVGAWAALAPEARHFLAITAQRAAEGAL